MGFHSKHNHGRAFFGEEAREQMKIHKRDSHGNSLVMHIPDNNKAAARPADVAQLNIDVANDVETAVSVIYVTLAQTFSGEASYSTLSDEATSTSAAAAAVVAASTTSASLSSATDLSPEESSYLAAKSSANALTTLTSSSHVTSSIAASSAAITSSAVIAVVGGTPIQSTRGATVVGGTPLAATRSSSAGAIDATSNGLSGSAKAGLAIGILLVLGLAFGLLFFCWRRKKNAQKQEDITNEKRSSFFDAGARNVEPESQYHTARASVLSDRSEIVPSSIRSTRTTSTAPRLSLRPVTQFLPNLGMTGNNMSEKPKSSWERRPSNATENPFEDAAVLSEKQANPTSPPTNPFDEPEGNTAAAAGTAKHSPKSSWEGSEPPTPKSTKFGTAAAVPVAASGNAAAPRPVQNNVHRIQLDFKPSMEDELELRSGQLVRMLHEYDDGWALCIRMDRSQQGVAPRTCLSKLPVKPRPQGPPPPQGARPGTADGNRRPSTSHGSNGMIPRPLTPQSSGNSESSAGSMPSRKPVPGQAM